jgi:hypothetical protein
MGKTDCSVLSLLANARRDGWTTSEGAIQELMEPLEAAGYEFIPTRPREAPIAVLKPRARSDGRKQSLTALHGTDEFPLHTDGAHMHRAPDYILLEQATASSCRTKTLLHRHNPSELSETLMTDLDQGVFVAANGRASFLLHARDKAGRVRFDPGCMRPLDDRARRVESHFQEMAATAVEYPWSGSQQLLVIDNTAVLHGRSRAPAGDERALRRLMIRRTLK